MFGEPWHAQTLALADLLVKSGAISSAPWAETLGAEIKALNAEPDDRETYFRAVLAALERLLAENGGVTHAELDEREHQWERAYLRSQSNSRQVWSQSSGSGDGVAPPYSVQCFSRRHALRREETCQEHPLDKSSDRHLVAGSLLALRADKWAKSSAADHQSAISASPRRRAQAPSRVARTAPG